MMSHHDEHGTFTWYELQTPDPDAARDFYGEVVGWSTAPFDRADVPYWLWMKAEDDPVGGVMKLPAEAEQMGVPPHWLAYVRVPDVDATAEKTEELGGKVLAGPESVDVGRWAVLEDPQGAVIALWTTADDSGGARAPEEKQFTWAELATTDHDAAFDFYAELFGWEEVDVHDMGEEMGTYRMFGHGESMYGGMFTKTDEMPGPPPSWWIYYVTVGDLDAALERVGSAGGRVAVSPMEVPGGDRVAHCVDPQGAGFALHEATG